MAISSSPIPLTTTLQALTDATWGLSVTLPDLSHGSLSGHHHAAHPRKPASGEKSATAKPPAGSKGSKDGKHKSAKADASAIQSLYDASDHPLKALAFLTELLAIVAPEEGKGKGAKAQPKKPSKEIAAKESGGTGIIRTSKVATLNFLGLSHAHLSMQTVSTLGAVLRAVSPSLTDLDLSFAYVGLHGARTLRTYLQAPRCQIVRLGLCGNNVGDEGSGAVSEGLRSNKTLTALDLRSNNISPAGLRSLCSALSPLGRQAGGVMHLVDLRGNPVPQAAALAAQDELRARGSSAVLRCGPALPAEFSLEAGAGAAPRSAPGVPPESVVLFQHPYSSLSPLRPSSDGQIDRATAILHSIDLRFASAHYSKHAGHPLCLEWDMRPTAARAALEWRLCVHSATEDRVLQNEKLSTSSCLSASAGVGAGEGAAWARCRAVLRDLPIKGTLHLSAWAPEDTAGGVECSNLVLYTIKPSPLLCVGHDEAAWSSAENAAAVGLTQDSAFGCPWIARLPRGFKALRTIKVTTGSSAAGSMRITWESKMATSAGQGQPGVGSGSGGSMGYEWVVLVGACQSASCVVAAKGECFPGDTADAALRPWIWCPFFADLLGEQAAPVVLPGDTVILAARVKSLYEGSVVPLEEGMANDSLAVQARSVALSAPQDKDTATLSACAGTTMMVSHNAANWS